MKKYYLILLLLFQSLVSAQNVRFTVISSPESGSKESSSAFKETITKINSAGITDFLIITGNISGNGKNAELENAKEILNELNGNYFLIPGESDSRFSESGSAKFFELFGDDKFIYESDSSIFIGLNSSSYRQIDGHIKPEDYKWLSDNLAGIDSTYSVYLFVYHNPKNEIDNWPKVNNLLSGFKKPVVFYGSSRDYSIENLFNIPLISIPRLNTSKNQAIQLFESRNDSLLIYDFNNEKIKLLNKISVARKTEPEIIETPVITFDEAELIWEYNLNYTLDAELTVANGLIYACDKSGLITCLDSTGNVLWEYDSFGTIVNKPVAADGIFAAATLQGDLLTLDAFTGESIQTIGFDDIITTPLISFDFTGPANFMIPKQSESKAAVVFGTSSGKLHCYDLETLQQIWVYDKINGMIAAMPVYIENKIIFPAFDNHLYCIDAQHGWLNWKWNGIIKGDDFPVLCNPAANNENVYLVSGKGNVYAVDILLGRTEWVNNKLNGFESIGISEIGHRLFIKSRNDKFHIISAKTSNWVKEINLRYGKDYSNVKPIEYNGKVLLGTKSGNVFLIDENFNSYNLFFMGSAVINSVIHFKDDMFAASNSDGKIVLFKLK